MMLTVREKSTLTRAYAILAKQVRTGPILSDPQSVRDMLRVKIGACDAECFGVLFLDTQHRLLDDRIMFTGTLNQTAVYPREVAKLALGLNAAAVVLYHNHPSGDCSPSQADRYLTDAMRTALGMLDVRVLDHIVVSANGVTSFAERGLI